MAHLVEGVCWNCVVRLFQPPILQLRAGEDGLISQDRAEPWGHGGGGGTAVNRGLAAAPRPGQCFVQLQCLMLSLPARNDSLRMAISATQRPKNRLGSLQA